ncbi:MAG: ion channel [Lysobacterales bacterium]
MLSTLWTEVPATLTAAPELPAHVPAHWSTSLLVMLIALAVIVACVLMHYEGLTWLQKRLGHVHIGPKRLRVLFGIIGVLAMHAVEIVFFALGYAMVHWMPDAGGVAGMARPGLIDLSYFSAITYTTVGYGDLVPFGALRFLAAVESLSGFVLVSWSASFTYLVMERFWRTS